MNTFGICWFLLRIMAGVALPLMLSACGTTITSLGGHLKSERQIPYYEIHLLTTLKDRSIVTIQDDPRGTLDHFLDRYNDTLGLIWATRIPVDREHPIEPLWISEGTKGITLIYKRFEDDDTSTIRGVIFDRATGQEITSSMLMGISTDKPRHSTIGPLQLVSSPDSSKILLYEVDMTEVEEQSENESITVNAELYDMDLNRLATRSLKTGMDRDIEGRAKETTSFLGLHLGNDGRVYQITRHGCSTLQALQWDIQAGTSKSLQWMIPRDDLKQKDIVIDKVKARLAPEGKVLVAASLMTDPTFTDAELAAAAIASFDFNRAALDFSRRFDLTEELIKKLTEGEEDELEFYWLSDLVHSPSSETIVLPFKHMHTVSQRDRLTKMTTIMYRHEHLLVLAFNRKGEPIWQTFVRRPELDVSTSSYLSDWWKIEGNEIHHMYMAHNALFVGRLSATSGEQLRSKPLLTIDDLLPWYSSSRWIGSNGAVLRFGTRSDARLVRVSY